MMKCILDETQHERDMELAQILGIPVEDVQKLPIAAPDSIRVHQGSGRPKDLASLYREFKHLNLAGYLRTLMTTSVTRRHRNLISLLRETNGSRCLDFGAGVGTHSIALMQGGNQISMLDVDGPLRTFALERIRLRFGNHPKNLVLAYTHDMDLPNEFFRTVVCTDVLEHVQDPLRELIRIWHSLEKGGIMHLEVSTMVKPSSGHFEDSIMRWKTDGVKFLSEAFTALKPTIYVKR